MADSGSRKGVTVPSSTVVLISMIGLGRVQHHIDSSFLAVEQQS